MSLKMMTKQGLFFLHANLSQCLCAGIQLKFHGVIMGLTLLLNHLESSPQLRRHQHTRRLVPSLLGCWGITAFPILLHTYEASNVAFMSMWFRVVPKKL